MNEGRFQRLSKSMAWALRHEATHLGLIVDPEGYVDIHALVATLNAQSRLETTVDEVRDLVAAGQKDKQRYTIIEGDWIRANYGHSLATVVMNPVATPPVTLLHGTAAARVATILAQGLKPMQRQFVQLTIDEGIARSVGGRHGKPAVLEIDAIRAHADGTTFYRANDRFWLAQLVPARFIMTRPI